MSNDASLTHDEFLMILNFTTRLLALDLNQETICERALEALSDFSGDRKVALLTLTRNGETLTARGLFAEGRYRGSGREIAYRGTPLEEVIHDKQYGIYPAAPAEDIPLPIRGEAVGGRMCLCLPLAASETAITGVVTIDRPARESMGIGDIQTLIILTTAVAISLENARLFRLATRDGLTGLYVRTVFDIRLQEELARLDRYGGAFAVQLLDIDHFKEVNDQLGHRRGDEVIRELAGIIRKGVRNGVDIVCRYGGDEFIILMTTTDRQEALRIAERVRSQCEGQGLLQGEGLSPLTVSMGLVSVNAGSATTAEEVIDRADEMLYKAKSCGRNRICCWS
jgi:two-component system, cell cycle response regulator